MRMKTVAMMAILMAALLSSSLHAEKTRLFPVDASPAAAARLSENVEYILSLSDEQVLAMVPVAGGGIYFTDCANCTAGTQDTGVFKWDPRKPEQLLCEGCGEVYPDNARYPDDQVIEVAAPQGVHRFRYYINAEGRQFHFRSHADYHTREYLQDRCKDLADLYHLTGDEVFARRAALILVRFAEVLPGYAYAVDLPHRPRQFFAYTQTDFSGASAYRTSRWTWWAYMDIPRKLLAAYETLRDWPGLATMADGRAGEMIERDLFESLVIFVAAFEDPLSNMSLGTWRDMIYAGRLLHRPEWIHEAVARFERLLAEKFLYDGHWMETSLSYHQQVVGGMSVVLDAIAGHSDPEGYVHPRTGRRFDDVDLTRAVPQYAVAQQISRQAVFPDDRFIPLNDTWAIHEIPWGRSKRDPWRKHRHPRVEPRLWPGLGLATLGGGDAEQQWLAYLNFTGGRHHKQRDALAIGLYAFDRELLPDLGYTHTAYRPWANSTMSHNTVVVNGRESELDTHHSGHHLLHYFAGDGFGLVSAESQTAYPGITTRYRRTLASVGHNSDNAYLIDIFDVRGGSQHDYLLHGYADGDSAMHPHGAALSPFDGTLLNEGVTWEPTDKETDQRLGREGAFGFIRELTRGDASDTFTVELRVAEPSQPGLLSHFAGQAGASVYLGRSPSLRRAAESDKLIESFQMPSLVLRRRGAEGDALESLFVTVHEPAREAGLIRGVSTDRSGETVLVRIDRGEAETDYLVYALDGAARAEFATSHGPLIFDGSAGLLRVNTQGQVIGSRALGASLMQLGAFRSEGVAGWRGEILTVHRGARGDARGWFEVGQTIEGHVAALIVRFADHTTRGFNVVAIEPREQGGSRVLVREDPGIEIVEGQINLVHFPQRRIAGEAMSYRLDAVR